MCQFIKQGHFQGHFLREKSFICLKVSLTLFFIFACLTQQASAAQKMWYSANDGGPNWRILTSDRDLAIDIGGAGSLDSAHAYSCSVIHEIASPDNSSVIARSEATKQSLNSYTMYYGGYDGTNWRILRATSTDGQKWNKEGVALTLGVRGSFDSLHVVYPYVLIDNGKYKMWYTANDGGKHWVIGYAESDDGIIFKNHQLALNVGQGNALDAEHLQSPVVLKQGGVYQMWYAGFGGTPPAWRIMRATSTDGIHFQKQGLVLDRGNTNDADNNNLLPGSVLFSEGTFKMWYWGQGTNWKIFQAVSKNGIDWEKKGIVKDLGPSQSLDQRALVVPAVVE